MNDKDINSSNSNNLIILNESINFFTVSKYYLLTKCTIDRRTKYDSPLSEAQNTVDFGSRGKMHTL